MKALIAATYAAGSVTCGICPAPGNVKASTRESAAASLATTGAKIWWALVAEREEGWLREPFNPFEVEATLLWVVVFAQGTWMRSR